MILLKILGIILAAVILLAALGVSWALLAAYAVGSRIKKRKMSK